MSERKKLRGRPHGDGVDDTAILEQVATLISAGDASNPTAALKRLKPDAGESEQRRIQRKWKLRGTALLAAHQKRIAKAESLPSASSSRAGYLAKVDALAISAARFQSLHAPAIEAMLRFQNGPGMQKIRAFQESPAYQRILAFQASPEMERIRQQHMLLGEMLARY